MARASDHVVELLAGVPLLGSLRRRELERLADQLDLRTFAEGNHLMMAHHRGEQFVLVVDGTAEVVRDGEQVATVGPGAFLGEVGLLSGGDRNATVRAVTKVKAFLMDGDTFQELRERHPRVAEQIDAEAANRTAD